MLDVNGFSGDEARNHFKEEPLGDFEELVTVHEQQHCASREFHAWLIRLPCLHFLLPWSQRRPRFWRHFRQNER